MYRSVKQHKFVVRHAPKGVEFVLYCASGQGTLPSVVRARYRRLAALGLMAIVTACGVYWVRHKNANNRSAWVTEGEEFVCCPNHGAEEKNSSLPEQNRIVMIRYTDEEIDRLLTLVPEIGRLTSRELEVLREILHGRKQGEVAYYLGIEVSTVKDFYRKIYDKLGVANKDGLFRMVSEHLTLE